MKNSSLKLWGLIVFAIGAILIGVMVLRPSADIAFDSNQWKQGNEKVKLRMLGDLIGSRLLQGMTKTEVANTLGHPPHPMSHNCWTYGLTDGWRHFVIDFEGNPPRVHYYAFTD